MFIEQVDLALINRPNALPTLNINVRFFGNIKLTIFPTDLNRHHSGYCLMSGCYMYIITHFSDLNMMALTECRSFRPAAEAPTGFFGENPEAQKASDGLQTITDLI